MRFKLARRYVVALVNDDYSDFSPAEQEGFYNWSDDWCAEFGGPWQIVVLSDETEFTKCRFSLKHDDCLEVEIVSL